VSKIIKDTRTAALRDLDDLICLTGYITIAAVSVMLPVAGRIAYTLFIRWPDEYHRPV